MKYFLASASPRRRELLTQIGIDYTVIVSEADEKTDMTDPARIVEELSVAKAQAVAEKVKAETGAEGIGDYCIIGADTIVACDGEVLGKPADEEDAFRMLRMIAGRTHQVFTGVTLLIHRDGSGETLANFHEETAVTMYDMSDEEIRAYIATGEPMDKAGAYGIQGRAAAFVKKIDGDYSSVVGLPVGRLYQELCKLCTMTK